MAIDKNTRRLGRGLDALLGQKQPAPARSREAAEESALREVLIGDVRPNRYQPRKDFRPEELAELRDSIKATGLLQPITVRQVAGTAGYELVAGERRMRAAASLGWEKIPAIVREFDDQTMLTIALVENLQRADLNPIEEAEGYARLTSEFSLTQQQIAELVGKDRSTIANLLRILQLPAAVRRLLESGQLTMGHARPLLALTDHALIGRIARETVDHHLSVRDVEQRVRQDAPRPATKKRGRPMKVDDRPAELRHIEDQLRKRLQTDVSVLMKPRNKGELRIQFYSQDDLERVLETIGVRE